MRTLLAIVGAALALGAVVWLHRPLGVADSFAPTTRDMLRILNSAERSLVQGRGSLDRRGDFNARMYNGSSCTITRIVYRLIPRGAPTEAAPVHSRAVLILPQESARVIVQDTVTRGRGLPRWFVDSVEGRCPVPAVAPPPKR